MSDPQSPRQLVVLCDGTNNSITGGRNDSNLVKLAELFARHPNGARLVHYVPGVGSAGQMPGVTLADMLARSYERLEGLVVGRGVYENVAQAYVFLMRNWRSERDRIFLFGFSRGAFTARAVAGLINRFGLLEAGMEPLVPTLLGLYFGRRGSSHKDLHGHYHAIAAQAQRLFAGGPPTWPDGRPNPQTRRVFVYFLGLWDTVVSVGLPPFGLKITAELPDWKNYYIVHSRHAVALDEHRAQYRQRMLEGPNREQVGIANDLRGSVKQVWFRGGHCDVGGYYPQGQTALSDQSMAWLLAEAVEVGLWLGPAARLRADGSAAGETAILEELQKAGLSQPGQPPMLHSELARQPLWALAGMCQRDTRWLRPDSGDAVSVEPVAHASVQGIEGPAVGKPLGRHTGALFWLALAASLLLPFVLGWLLQAEMPGEPRSPGAGQPLELLGRNGDFQRWQFGVFGALQGEAAWTGWWQQLAGFAAPRWALVWDLGFIVAYAIVLSFLASWAFVRACGLPRVDQAPSRALNTLGYALTLLVLADLAENLLLWLGISGISDAKSMVQHGLGTVLALLAGLASLAKFVGLAGVLVLLLWGLLRPGPR